MGIHYVIELSERIIRIHNMTLSDRQKREVFHLLFLEELLKTSDPKLYVLKGGVNLRFFFNSPRYSEDMDLDVLAGNVATLKKNGYKILQSAAFSRSLQTYGIARLEINDPSRAKQTETTQRFRLRLVTDGAETLPTKVEFSRRPSDRLPCAIEKIAPEIARPYQRLAFRCQHYSGEAAAVQKVKALAGREITQARDVFDLGILHAGGYLNSSLLKQFIAGNIIRQARGNVLSIEYRQFSDQVLEFLEQEVRAEYPKAVWDEMKATVMGILSHEE